MIGSVNCAMNNPDILICLEDPGATNCILPLLDRFSRCGWNAKIVLSGLAREKEAALRDRSPEVVDAEGAAQLLDALSPALLFLGTSEDPDSPGLKLIEEARHRRIPSAAIIDAPTHAEWRFRGRRSHPLAYAPDHLFVPDEFTRDAYVRAGFPAGSLHIVGNPHFDKVLSEKGRLDEEGSESVRKRILGRAASGEKVILFASEGTEKLPLLNPDRKSASYPSWQSDAFSGRTEILLEAFLHAVSAVSPKPFLVLRPHPKDRISDYAAFCGRFDRVDHHSPPLDLAYCADLVVGATSMLITEAAILGKATLSMLPRIEEKEWLYSARIGLTPWVTEMGELKRQTLRLLAQPPLSSPAAPCVPAHGRSCDRIIDILRDLIRRKASSPRVR